MGDLPRLAILGAGPIGIEAALQAAVLNLPFTVYERGKTAEHLRQWGHVRLFSPFGMNSTPLGRAQLHAHRQQHRLPGEPDLITGREHIAVYLEPLVQTPILHERMRTETTVVQIGRRGLLKEDSPADIRRAHQPFLLLLRTKDKRELIEEADVVLDCTGTYGQPRSLGDSGILAPGETAARPHVAWGLEDVLGERSAYYSDKTTLVIGAGYSAATTVCNLAKLAEKHPATWVVWLARGTGTQPIKRIVNDPFKERDQLAVRANMLATRGDGNVEFHPQTTVTAIECAGPDKGFKVHTRCAGKPKVWEADRLIANVGYTPENSIYRELHVPECFLTLAPKPLADACFKQTPGEEFAELASSLEALRAPEPNFFLLGSKSFGRDGTFLLRTGFEQVRTLFDWLLRDAESAKRFPSLRQLRTSARVTSKRGMK
jgi:thioredoxin reductase